MSAAEDEKQISGDLEVTLFEKHHTSACERVSA